MRRGLALLLAAALLPGCAGDRHDFAITPRVFPTASPTEAPVPTRTPRPTAPPTRTPLPSQLWVSNSGRDGVVLRSAPGAGDRLAGLADGTALVPQGNQRMARREGAGAGQNGCCGGNGASHDGQEAEGGERLFPLSVVEPERRNGHGPAPAS